MNKQIEEIKCFSCIHAPICMAQKGGVNLQFASENDCCYYQPKLPNGSVTLTQEEWEVLHNDCVKTVYNARQDERRETAEEWREHVIRMLLTLLGDNKITTHTYNDWVEAFNELAKQCGVEVDRNE